MDDVSFPSPAGQEPQPGAAPTKSPQGEDAPAPQGDVADTLQDTPIAADAEAAAVAPDHPKSNGSKPTRPKKGIFRRLVVVMLEIMAAFAGILVLGIGAGAWYISRGPVDAGFLLPHIEKAMNEVRGNMRLDIEGLVLEWHGLSSPMGLEAKNVTLMNSTGPFMNIATVDLDISLKDSMLHGLRFSRAQIAGLSMRLQRNKDGDIRLFNLEGEEGARTANTSSPLTLSRIATNLPPIFVLHLEDARIAYHDEATGRTRIFADVDMEMRRPSLDDPQGDVTGFVTATLSPRPDEDRLTIDYIYDGEQQELSLSARLEDADIGRLITQFSSERRNWDITVPFSGKIAGLLGENWDVRMMEMSARLEAGTAMLPDFYGDRLLNIDGGVLTLALNPVDRHFSINEANLSVEGVQIDLTGGVTKPAPEAPHTTGRFELQMPLLSADHIAALWPLAGRDEPAYDWLVTKMSGGTYEGISVRLDIKGELPPPPPASGEAPDTAPVAPTAVDAPDVQTIYNPALTPPVTKPDPSAPAVASPVDVSAAISAAKTGPDWRAGGFDWFIAGLNADFSFKDMKVDYNPPMVAAEGVTGTGHIEGKAMTLDIASARVGDLAVGKGALFFDDLVTPGAGHVKIDLSFTGPLRAALDYLSREPIHFDRDLSLDRKAAEGAVVADVHIAFPATKHVKTSDIRVTVNGTIEDAVLPGVLHGLSLSGGPFKIEASDADYRMTGKGRLAGRPVDLDWHSYFSEGEGHPYSSRIQASLSVDDELRRMLGVHIGEYVSGAVPSRIDYTDNWGAKARALIDADLTDAIVLIPHFEFAKAPGRPARLNAAVELEGGRITMLDSVQVEGPDLDIENGRITFAKTGGDDLKVTTAVLDRLRFAGNDFGLKMEDSGPVLKLAIEGARLDARAFIADEEDSAKDTENAPKQEQDYDIGLRVQTLQLADDSEIKAVQGFMKGRSDRLEQFEMDAAVGSGGLFVRYKPNAGDAYNLRLEADDAGAALKAFGVTDKVTGGRLTVAGIPLAGGRQGDVRGIARIDDFQVRAAPAFASLLKLMDVPTLLTSFNTKGLSFARLETEFEWRNRRGGGLIRLIDGRTSGGSMGLTFAGDINKTHNTIDVAGTVVPASTLNSFFGGIPLVGDLLTGGSGSIFAATYKMTGSSEDPKTTINPLSVLAPGFIRSLLFEN